MPFGYPVMLELRGRRCVLIGETAVRERKVEGLLAAGADHVVVIAPGAADVPLGAEVRRHPWEPDDLDGAFLVVASSDDAAERAATARCARVGGALVNVMDDVPNCDWAAPSVVRRGDLVFAIATGGGSPPLARALRLELSGEFGAEWAEVVRVLSEVRDETMRELPDVRERARRWRASLDVKEAGALAKQGEFEELRHRLLDRLRSEAPA
jgi:precorrin-2 dehydrogenase / sirohydrochlorin ferrochelatase